MSHKAIKSNKKERSAKTKNTINLVLDDGEEIYRDHVVRDTNECFEIDEITIDEIRVSKKYPYGENGKYRNFVCYEQENKYVPLKIVLRYVEGYYEPYKGIDNMNVMLKNDAYEVIFGIFENIEKSQILKILFINLRLVIVMTILRHMRLEQAH